MIRQGDIDRVGAAVDTDATANSNIGRHVSFEDDAFRSENELPGSENPVNGGENFLPQRLIFTPIIPEWWWHCPYFLFDQQ